MSQVSQNPYTFTMPDSAVSVSGNFARITVALTVSAETGGNVTVTFAGHTYTVDGGTSQTFQVPVGATVELDAQPITDYEFEYWIIS